MFTPKLADFHSLGTNPDLPTTSGDYTVNKEGAKTNMKKKTKNNKVPKSAKTRLSDLTPKKDARGGKNAPDGVGRTPPVRFPAVDSAKRHVTL